MPARGLLTKAIGIAYHTGVHQEASFMLDLGLKLKYSAQLYWPDANLTWKLWNRACTVIVNGLS